MRASAKRWGDRVVCVVVALVALVAVVFGHRATLASEDRLAPAFAVLPASPALRITAVSAGKFTYDAGLLFRAPAPAARRVERGERGSTGSAVRLLADGRPDGASHRRELWYSADLRATRGGHVGRVLGKLWRYPQVLDPRTGQAIRFPVGSLSPVPRASRVSWGANERAAFIRDWYERGYQTPRGGWESFDIHHIHPRELVHRR